MEEQDVVVNRYCQSVSPSQEGARMGGYLCSLEEGHSGPHMRALAASGGAKTVEWVTVSKASMVAGGEVDEITRSVCPSTSPGEPEFTCVRQAGHAGDHRAHPPRGTYVADTVEWSAEVYCRRPKGHTGGCSTNPIAQPGDVDKQHNPPPSRSGDWHTAGAHLADPEEPETELQQDLRKFHVRGEDGKCRDDAQAWPCNTAISWIRHGAQPIDTAEDENTAQADAEAAWSAYKAEYARQRPYLSERRAGRQMRKREFIAGYMAALPEWNG